MKHASKRRAGGFLAFLMIIVLALPCAAADEYIESAESPTDAWQTPADEPVFFPAEPEHPEAFTGDADTQIDDPAATPLPSYAVTFFDMYGNVYAWAEVPWGGYVLEPERPSIPDFHFLHWCDETDLEHMPYVFGEPVYRDINLWPMLAWIHGPDDMPIVTPEPGIDDPLDLRGAIEGILGPRDEPTPDISEPDAPDTSATGDAPSFPEEMDVNSLLQTPAPQPEATAPPPEETQPSQPEDTSAEGIIANILGDTSFLGVEESPVPIDAHTVIAELLMSPDGTLSQVTPEPPAEEESTPQPLPPGEMSEEAVQQLIWDILSPTHAPEQEASADDILPDGPDEPMEHPEQAATDENSMQDILSAMEGSSEEEPTATPSAAPADEMETLPPAEPIETTDVATDEPKDENGDIPMDIGGVTEPMDVTAGDTASYEETTVAPESTPSFSPEDVQIFINSYSRDSTIGLGSEVILTSEITGLPTGATLVYQWQNDASGAFSDVPGATESTYTYRVTMENAHCNWRLLVSVMTD